MRIKGEELSKEEGDLLTGLALRYGVGIIPQAVETIKQVRQEQPETEK